MLDLLLVHPSEDDNGRVARVLTHALLADAGSGVRCPDLEQLVTQSSDDDAARIASTHRRHDGAHDPRPRSGYLVTEVGPAYRQFQQRPPPARPGDQAGRG